MTHPSTLKYYIILDDDSVIILDKYKVKLKRCTVILKLHNFNCSKHSIAVIINRNHIM